MVTPAPIHIRVLHEDQANLLLWSEQFTDPSPVLHVCEQRHWKKYFEDLREGGLGNGVVVLDPEHLSGLELRQAATDARQVIVPVRPNSIFAPTYGEILHGRQFFGPTVLVVTQATLDVRNQNSRTTPAEPREDILAVDQFSAAASA